MHKKKPFLKKIADVDIIKNNLILFFFFFFFNTKIINIKNYNYF